MDVHPGPILRDVLVIEAGDHRCDAVWAEEEYAKKVLKCHRTCTSLYTRTLIVNRQVRVSEFLREYGFYGVEKVGGLQLDCALITALVGRWRPETHSFHLPFGEVGITLQDVEVLLGLPIDGNPLAGMTGRSKDQWIQICADMMGFRPQTSDITSTMIKMSAIVPKELTDQSLDVDYLQHARAIMFKFDVLEDGFQGVESVYGKFSRHQSRVYVGLRPLPINDEPIWRHFIRKASREYDVVEVFIGVSKNVEEEADGNPFFHQQMDQPSSSHFAQHIDSDPDDAEYIAPSTEDEESSEEEEDISADEGEDGQDVRAMPQLHDRQSHVLNLSLRPMFHIPIIEVDNRHGGIDHAFKNIPELQGGQVTRRFCLHHVRSNFHIKFPSKKLKNMMYKAGKTPSRSEFEQTLLQIASKNQEAYNWLRAIPKHMWALSHDEGGSRHGITTTNSSESFNHVLKGCRCLPIFAIVRFTYDKLVKLFVDRRTNGYLWQQSGYNFPMNVWKKIKNNEENRLYCRVVQHHAQHGIYSVVVDGSFNNGHRETFVVNLNGRTCTCGDWSYINAYSDMLMPLPDEADWPTSGYEIRMRSLLLIRHSLRHSTMASPKLYALFVFLLSLFSRHSASDDSSSCFLGMNYGRIADNLPSPSKVVELLKSQGIRRVKLYDTDSEVLAALSGSGITTTVALPNDQLSSAAAADRTFTDSWVRSNVVPYKSIIEAVAVGNEVFVDPANTTSYLVPAMRNVYASLA
ncbi:unnamed protein product, partial [Cuscuta campestris]